MALQDKLRRAIACGIAPLDDSQKIQIKELGGSCSPRPQPLQRSIQGFMLVVNTVAHAADLVGINPCPTSKDLNRTGVMKSGARSWQRG
jgi:hypothetical protein